MTRTPSHDVAVIGLGAMGSSAALHLARRGLRVLGIDRYSPPHDRGSSHGKTRLIREAYYEDPSYVPLVRRSLQLWQELEREVGGASLLVRTGSIMIGSPGTELVQGTLESAARHQVPHELLAIDRLQKRFPMFSPLDDMVGVFEPGASLLIPERVIALQLELAGRAGAALSYGERVVGCNAVIGGVEIHTERGSHLARYAVFCTGAWTAGLLPAAALPLEVERQVQAWWEPARFPELFRADRMPVTMWQLGSGWVFYTMPDFGDGLKVGWHHGGRAVDPDTVDREVSAEEHAGIVDLLRRFVPHAKGQRRGQSTCVYTNTPDRHFIVDWHPAQERVLIVSACSGHGFKFASVMGEIVADLVTAGRSAFDLTPFRLGRFTAPASPPA